MVELHSRIERIGGTGGYRDIMIQEMTEMEIQSLHTIKWLYAGAGFLAGGIIFTAIHWWSIAEAVAKHCA